MGNTPGTPRRPASPEEFVTQYHGRCKSTHNQSGLKEGICHGMCLDWIRSMLKDSGTVFKAYAKLDDGKLKILFEIQENLHNMFVAGHMRRVEQLNKEGAAHHERQRLLKPQVDEARRREMRALDASIKLDKIRGILIERGFGDFPQLGIVDRQYDRVAALREQRTVQLEKDFASAEARVLAIAAEINDSERMYHHAFEYFKQNYERAYRIDRYVGIQVEPGVHHTWTRDTLGEWFAKIRTCLSLLTSGRCALLNFSAPGAGHFVAFCRQVDDYHLFDPNVGWYIAQGVDAVWVMFEDLWRCWYASKPYREATWRVFFV